MKLLFFIDPGVEHGQPYLRLPWIDPFCINLITILRKSKQFKDCRYGIAYGEVLDRFLSHSIFKSVKKYKFRESELYPDKNYDWLDLSSQFYLGSTEDKYVNRYSQVISRKLSEFNPDIIISFSPVPFLRAIFPNSLILHHEVGFTSKEPYPHTWYFDPFGMVFHPASFFNRHVEEIQNKKLTFQQQSLINEYKHKCKDAVSKLSPFKDFLGPIRKRFKRIALLPLMRFDTYAAHARFKGVYKSQYDFVKEVIDNVNEDTGLIVIPRPGANQELKPDAIDFLKYKYSNFIYNKKFLQYDAPSQYALPYVDILIGGFTSLSLQTLLWDISLVSIGDYRCIPDGYGINSINSIDPKNRKNRDPILYWLLKYYFFPTTYLQNSQWLGNFLVNSLDRFGNNDVGLPFYDPIDDDDKLFKSLNKQFVLTTPVECKRNIWNQFFDDPGLVEVIPEITEQLKQQSIAGKVLLKVFSHLQEGRVDTAIELFTDELGGRLIYESAIHSLPRLTHEISRSNATDRAIHQLLGCFDSLYLENATRQQSHWAIIAQHIHNLAIRLLHDNRWAAASECLQSLEKNKLTIQGGAYALSVALYNQGRREESRDAAMQELHKRPEHRRASMLVEMIDGKDAQMPIFDYSTEQRCH